MKERGTALATLALCVLFCFKTTCARAENVSPLGLWENEDATFQIFESAGKLCAKIVALKVPKTPEGKEKTDIHNPDPARRGTPIKGLVFMSGFAKKFERLGGNVADWPLSAYRGRSYYAMRTDALDRFGTRLEHRMTQAEIRVLMENAGLGEVRFSDGVPFWCAIGRKI